LLSEKSAPDSTRLFFITKNGHWTIGTWDSDHDQYTDDFSQPIYDILLWADIPDLPHTGYKTQIIASPEAAIALYKLTKP